MNSPVDLVKRFSDMLDDVPDRQQSPSMNPSPGNIRIPRLKTALAVLLVFAVNFGVVRSTVGFASEGGILCEDIALDDDATDDPELFLPKLNPVDWPTRASRPDAIGSGAPIRNLSQPPAIPPPISA